MVTVLRHNLLDPIPPHVATCQVVMCRNVLIYFKLRHAESFLERLADAMPRTACLFVGAAETLWQMTDRFEPAQIGVSYVYRPIPRGAVRRTAAAPSGVTSPQPPSPALSFTKPLPPRHAPHLVTTPALVSEPAAQPLDETGQEDGRLGRQLLASGSLQPAIVAFRRWAFLAPDDPTAYFQLGSALDEAEARPSALRAYRAAIAALDRCEPERLVELLHGYNPAELRRLLVDRCLVAESS